MRKRGNEGQSIPWFNNQSEGVNLITSNTTPSAFRAVNITAQQPVTDGNLTKVSYPNEEFDIGNVYSPNVSTFIPQANGIYSITGSVFFIPANAAINHRISVFILVNNVERARVDSFFVGGIAGGVNHTASVNTILQLQASDQVEVFVLARGVSGIIQIDDEGTHFEAARVPSPTT